MKKLPLASICGVVVSLMLWPGSFSLAAPSASEVEALRRELERTQTQVEALTNKMQELQQRLRQVEAAKVEPAQPSTQEPSSPAGMLQTPLGQRQLLFDVGVLGDFVYAYTSGEDNDPRRAGTFAGLEDRAFPREVELVLSGRVDPFARADVFLEFAEEAEFEAGHGEFERELEVGLEEAYLTLLELPLGLQARIGKMRPRFGRLNEIHPHDLPQVDRPDVLVNFFGREQLKETGLEMNALLPTPFFQELSTGVFNGDNEVSFGRGDFEDPLVTAHLRNFFELSEASALQVGLSGAEGPNAPDQRSYLAGLDLTYKWLPPDEPFTALTLQGELLYSHRETEEDDKDRYGAYLFGDYRLSRNWGLGTRLDWSEFPEEGGREWAVTPYVTLWASDFLRFRLQYKHTDRNFADDLAEVFFQASFTLGFHPPHRF
ncbi:MAG: hypothetical protein ACE5I9_04725 [Candidatus Methylomirabilales bacterium]